MLLNKEGAWISMSRIQSNERKLMRLSGTWNKQVVRIRITAFKKIKYETYIFWCYIRLDR